LSSKQVKVKRTNTGKEIKREVKTEIKEEVKKGMKMEVKKEIKKEDESWEGCGEIRQEELTRPCTPAPSPSKQTQKRLRSLSSPQQLPRPEAPAPPVTPRRKGTNENVLDLLELGVMLPKRRRRRRRRKKRRTTAQGLRQRAKSGQRREVERSSHGNIWII
jgi:hypothetical protein